MSNKTYARNVDDLKEFSFDYAKWPKSSKVLDGMCCERRKRRFSW